MRNARNSFAFTLVELLVVIAIISLLVSMMLPSMSMVKELARSDKCKENLHLMGQGVLGYVGADKNGAIPPGGITIIGQYVINNGPDGIYTDKDNGGTLQHVSIQTQWAWYWPDFIQPYFDADARPTQGGGTDCIGNQPADGIYDRSADRGIKYSRKMDCPSQVNSGGIEYSWNSGTSSWPNDDNVGIWHLTGLRGQPTFVPPRPYSAGPLVGKYSMYDAGRYCIVLEPAGNFYWEDNTGSGLTGSYGRVEDMASRAPHNATSNGLMLDGHVENYSRLYLEQMTYNRLYGVAVPEFPNLRSYPFCPIYDGSTGNYIDHP